MDYPLGDEEVTVCVVQEFKADFVEELDDVRHDPIEVTLDKKTKKELLVHLSQLSGGQDEEKYWEACLREHAELQTDVFMELGSPEGQPHTSPALPGLPADHRNHQGHTSPALPGLPADHHSHQGQSAALHGLPADHHNHQGQPPQTLQGDNDHQGLRRKPPQLPGHEGLNERCRSLRKTGSLAKWDHEQGFLTMLCVDPLWVPLHEVGPGHRNLRWTAIRDRDAWRWTEKAQMGKLEPNIVDAEAVLIFYGWNSSGLGRRPEGDHSTVAERDLHIGEASHSSLTCVNLGHPGRAEFVRLLKAAGCRAE